MSSPIRTRFTQLTGVKTPIISAAMAGAAGGALAAQVTLAGGFGFLAAGYESAEKLCAELDIARNLIKPDENAILPIGAGFLGWLLDKSESLAHEQLSAVLQYRVQAIWLSFGDRLEHWVTYIRNQLKKLKDAGDYRPLIFIQITSAKEAETAVNVLKADVIVAQGREAGGHGSVTGLPLLTLVPSILAVVPPNGPPVIAAGGLVTGAHMAALLSLGAAGIVIGTRFLLSPESLYTESQRQALLKADSTHSVRTMAFDEARDTLGWPKGIDGRALHNDTVDDYNRGEDIQVLRNKYQEAHKKGDTSRVVVWAGAGVGLMDRVQSAKGIVNEVHNGCLERIKEVWGVGL